MKLLFLLLASASIHAAAELHTAVPNNYVRWVDELIRAGADVNAYDKDGRTPLMHIKPGTPDKPYTPFFITQELVNHGANVNARDNEGKTPLHHLTSWYSSWEVLNPNQKRGIEHIATYLIEQGADVNATIPVTNETPLFLAIIMGNIALVQELLKAPEIDLNIKSKFGDEMLTPLELATAMDADKIIDLLEKAQQVQEQAREKAHTESCKEAAALAEAGLHRAGAKSPARRLKPAHIQRIHKILERELYKELIRHYLGE